ncbi:hypothetical protein OHA04_27775 [Streptomyces sp. NBC_01590]|uniref:hypothetical protein n=1 Tax=Streptomyces sp. NBC_01590 TaxID=2975887 RepID=UPI00386D2EAF
MTTATTHFTAWLGTNASVLDQDNMDVVVLEDELFGDPAEGATAWSCKGEEALFTGITDTPAEDGDHKSAQREAEALLSDAGWSTVGEWDDVDTGYTITVVR